MALKILVVGTAASIHTGRFVLLLQEIGYEVRLFNHSLDYAEDEHIRDIHVYVPQQGGSNYGNTLEKWPQPFLKKLMLKIWGLRHRFQKNIDQKFHAWATRNDQLATSSLIRIVEEWQPSLVISLKMQNDGYTVANARKSIGMQFPPWLHFNWGTDIAYYGCDPVVQPFHLDRIQSVLSLCDFHIADCMRDVRLAQEFGLCGESLGSCVATGGFDLAHLSTIRTIDQPHRKIILVKGRHWPPVALGMNIVHALADLKNELKDLTVKFIMCTPDVERAVRSLADAGAPFEVVPRLPYEELLAEFAQARVTISATTVDGTPLFLAETIAMGAVPIHSDLDSVREWVEDGENGLLFAANSIEDLKLKIRRAILDDAFIESAAKKNFHIASERLDRSQIREQVRDLIDARIMKMSVRERRVRETGQHPAG